MSIAPAHRGGNSGGYIEAEHKFAAADEPGLAVFGRFGFANSDINQFNSYAGFGGSYQGLLAARPDDLLGLALAKVRNGNPFRRAQALAGAPVGKSETNIELTYRAEVTPWLTIQPDAQYVINPGADPALKNAFVVGLRFEIGFGQDF